MSKDGETGWNRNSDDYEASRRKSQVVRSILKFAISVMMQDEPNIDILLNDNNTYDVNTKEKRTRRAHFIDCLFNDSIFPLSNSTISEDSEFNVLQIEDGSIKKTKEGQTHKKKQSLSLRQIAVNFQLLSKRLSVITEAMKNFTGVINWERNDKTLAVLLLYTWACIHPHFFLLYPIMLFIYYVSGKYLTRHPIVEKPSMYLTDNSSSDYWDNGLGPRLKYARSNAVRGLFGFLWETERETVELDGNQQPTKSTGMHLNINETTLSAAKQDEMDGLDFQTVDEMLVFIEDTVAKESASHSLPPNSSKSPPKITPVGDETSNNNTGKSQGDQAIYRNFIMKTLYDIQIQTTQILNHFDNIQMAIAENCEFIDEKESTLLVFKLFLIVSIGCILGSYIPWKTIFIVSVWIGVSMNHPRRREFIDRIMGPSAKPDSSHHDEEKRSDPNNDVQETGLFSVTNVVINEPVFAREVQIFELQQQDIMRPNEYIPMGFTGKIFCISEEIRLQRKKPECVYDINDVLPPLRQYKMNNVKSDNEINIEVNIDKHSDKKSKRRSSLYWDYISGENWRLSDTKWVEDARSSQELYVKPYEDEGWVYDITGEFRRRRWVRRIFQHG